MNENLRALGDAAGQAARAVEGCTRAIYEALGVPFLVSEPDACNYAATFAAGQVVRDPCRDRCERDADGNYVITRGFILLPEQQAAGEAPEELTTQGLRSLLGDAPAETARFTSEGGFSLN